MNGHNASATEPVTNTAEQVVEEHRHLDRRALTPKLSAARQWTLWTTILLLVVTGAAWLWAEYLYTPAENSVESYEIKHLVMVVHAAFALVFVFITGTLLYTHMQTAWRQARNRASGVFIASLAGILLLSGYALWYAGGETLRNVSELAHWITGFALPAVLLVHAALGKRSRRQR